MSRLKHTEGFYQYLPGDWQDELARDPEHETWSRERDREDMEAQDRETPTGTDNR